MILHLGFFSAFSKFTLVQKECFVWDAWALQNRRNDVLYGKLIKFDNFLLDNAIGLQVEYKDAMTKVIVPEEKSV